MSLFYKTLYRCRKCGKTYAELPVYCSCGTELSFICPCDMWNINTEFHTTMQCEEIKKSIFSFGKKKRIEELEDKIQCLEREILRRQEEIKKLREENIKNDTEIRKLRYMQLDLERLNAELNRHLQYWQGVRMFEKKMSIPDGTIEAVKYAMKHAHPDNGGNASDFIRFQKCYEELTRK